MALRKALSRVGVPYSLALLARYREINVDFWARYKDDLWLDHDGDGWAMTPKTQLWLTPGHTEEDASLIVDADDGVYAMTHLWWLTDRTPDVDPVAPDQSILDVQRKRVLAAADIVIPGHGEAFKTGR